MFLNKGVVGRTALWRVTGCCGEKLEELDPLLLGSEQFKLQQSRAIETCELSFVDCAFLQQSGMPAIEPSPSCAPTPSAPPSMAATRTKAVNHLPIVETEYRDKPC
jgi:hypothetical protein